jgi:soluble lytic murein transglycosylase-like protein
MANNLLCFPYKYKHLIASLIISIAIIFTLINVPKAQAEPYLRIQKNGVVYYYFSNRGNNFNRQPSVISKRSRIIGPPARYKLSLQELEPLVQEAGRHHNLPPPLIKAVIRVESNFNPAATSPKGAQGLMQLMPGTAEQLQVTNPYDIKENIWAGTRYLGMLLQKFNNNLPLALAAYNAGPERVRQYRDIPPIKETQGFVRDVCTNFLQYSGEPAPPR